MEASEQRLDEQQLRAMSTGELVRHALEETRLLVKAEVLHAKQELRDELKAAQRAGVMGGAALGLALVGVSLLFVALALALPLPEPVAALVVGVILLVAAGVLALMAVKRAPRRPLPITQARVHRDVELARGQLT